MPAYYGPAAYIPTPEEEAYAPVEPGMYAAPYSGPGQYAEPLPVVSYGDPIPANPPPPEPGPGMYEPLYQGPGQYTRPLQPLEPGIYEPTYTRPGEYAPLEPSAQYGGPVWPPYHNGAAMPSRSAPPWGNPGITQVDTMYPATGAPPTSRNVPILGDATILQPGASQIPDPVPMPAATSRGDVLGQLAGGGTAPPRSLATVGPTALEMGYRYQQGDPGVVMQAAPARGTVGAPMLRSDVTPSVADLIAGLYGGGGQRTSQDMPLPPGSRRSSSRPLPRRR